MEIRPYRHPEDAVPVIALWNRCGLIVPWNDPHCDILRKLRVGPDLFLIGLVGDARVATVMAGYDGHRGWLNYVAVDPGWRRRGLGRLMIQAAEDRLCALGCPKINLQVRQTNLGAAEFYRRLGYVDDPVISLGKRLIQEEP